MKRVTHLVILSATLITGTIAGQSAFCAETPASPDIKFTLEPTGYIAVNGDSQKFRSHHWMDTGYQGGIKEFGYEAEYPDDVTLSVEGHALTGEGDYGAEANLKKEGFGYILFDYKQFRKWYDSTGGVFYNFTAFPHMDTDKPLHLDIGEFSLEAGLRKESLPEVTLNYAREFREGTKSRLSWGSVAEGTVAAAGAGDVVRKIAPSWQNIDEIVDKYEIKAEDTLSGVHWKAQQQWESVRSKNQRHEQNYSTTPNNADGTNSDQKIRDQFTEPRSDLIATILGLDKWVNKDKLYISSGYRFSQMTSRELENIIETDQNGNVRNFSNPEQVRDAYSDNLYTTQTWVSSLMAFVTNTVSVNGKFKADTIHRDSASTYRKDLKNGAGATGTSTVPVTPDGIIDQMDVSNNQDKAMTYGESVSIRYSGIPRVALYNEYEFQQTRNNIYEDRQSSSAGEVFNRQTIAHSFRGSGTLGARWVPWDAFSVTADVRHREDDTRYNNVRVTGADSARSVFVQAQTIQTDELTTKFGYKPCKWFQPSFRYQLTDRAYLTSAFNDPEYWPEAGQTSNIYTWEIVTQPTDDFLGTASFSYDDSKMFTPASSNVTNVSIPTFNSDVFTFLLNGEYSVNDKLTFSGVYQFSDASNFNDYNSGIPYGVDYTETDISASLQWKYSKDLTIEPKYGFYRYDPNPSSEFSGYNAQMITVQVNLNWG